MYIRIRILEIGRAIIKFLNATHNYKIVEEFTPAKEPFTCYHSSRSKEPSNAPVDEHARFRECISRPSPKLSIFESQASFGTQRELRYSDYRI